MKEYSIVVNEWKNYKDLDLSLKEELNNLNEEELRDAFYTNLEFGTGGMRGILGPGTNRMNIYTIRKANYGYGKYLLKDASVGSVVSCVIAYDCRKNSLLFAQESAKVLATMGIKVYLFKKITPTPELSFAVRHLKCQGGIVVTASHNPPKYNGYKIYDSFGCQLVPMKAQIVIDEIASSPDAFDIRVRDYEQLEKDGLIEYVSDEVDDTYIENVKSISVIKNLKKDNFKLVFTSLHGTSAVLGQRLLKEVGYNFIPVKEQMVPDPNFSTVPSPNPEDHRAFKLAIEYAKENNADICIATDPDADRVGLAVLHDDEYFLLTGNQTGAILMYYLVNNRPIKENSIMFNTIVTSSLGAAIAKKHNIAVYSSLTGFKFIGEQAQIAEENNQNFFFGYEESYGYVVSDFVRDKDSLQALLLCSEVACYYKQQNKTLIDILNEIYEEYGYYSEGLENISLIGEQGAIKITRILNHFRSLDNIDGLNVIAKEDYELQTRKDQNGLSRLLLPKSNVIKYFLDDGSWFVLRPSGTEPKMKIYVSSIGSSKDESIDKVNKIKNIVLDIVNNIE